MYTHLHFSNTNPFLLGLQQIQNYNFVLCKLCLNTQLLFDKICSQANADNEELDYSISDFLMTSCKCYGSENGFYKLNVLSRSAWTAKKDTKAVEMPRIRKSC